MLKDRSIEFLLKLYEAPYVKGEKQSKKTRKRIRHNTKLKNRYLILDELLLESKSLTLTRQQYQLVKDLIRDYNNRFKELHKRAKEKTIILAFIFFTKKIGDSRVNINDWRICKKYELTDQVFEIILCKLVLGFMRRCPIVPREYGYGDHDALVKEGRR